MSNPDHTRKEVSRSYARAVTAKPAPDAAATCCARSQPKGAAVKLAGYHAPELESLPPDAVVNSFGCGNPLAFGEVKAGDVVVDLGSGAGIDLLLAAQKVGPTGRVIGIDMTDEMIAKARENLAAAGATNIEVRKGLIEDLPIEANSVDWVISNCVINLSPEKPRVFREIARILKPGGRMLVSDIVVEDLPPWVREDQALYNSCVAGAISEREYVAGLRDAGLVEVEVTERLVYAADQLQGIIESDVREGCCGESGSGATDDAAHLGQTLAGKIWSAYFKATKPGP
jgi:SAM-dependent methyltransferase